eukprot:56090_1
MNSEEKTVDDIVYCAATQRYDAKHKLLYVDKSVPLISEHIKMYNDLRQFIDDILQKKISWKLTVLSPKMLGITNENIDLNVDEKEEEKQNDSKHDKYATDEMYEYLQQYATENTLIRYITGSDYKLEVAKEALLEAIQWRVICDIDNITPGMFENSLQQKAIYSLNHIDKKGHGVCYFKILQNPADDPWIYFRAAVWSIEKCVKLASKNGVNQIILLIDIEHLQYSTLPPIAILKQIAYLCQHYYPERLYRAYVLFSPWIFRMVWKMVSGLLTENTKGKIIVPGWVESGKYESFEKDIDKTQLLEKYGGLNDNKYSYEWEVEQYDKSNQYK